MLFRMGRKDAEDEHKGHDSDHGHHKGHGDDDHGHHAPKGHDDHGHHTPKLPAANESYDDILKKMLLRGFTKTDFVSLMGSHTIGFAHLERTGLQGRWTQNPHVFDNSYFKEVLLGDRSKYLKT